MRESRPLSGWILLGAAVLAATTQLSGCERSLAAPVPRPAPEVVAPGGQPGDGPTTARGPFNDRYHLTPGAGRSTAAPAVGSTSGPVLVDPLWHDRPATDRTLLLA